MFQFSDYTFIQDTASSATEAEGTLLIPYADIEGSYPEELEVVFPDGRVATFVLSGQTYFLDTDSDVDQFVGWSYWESGFKGPALQVLIIAEDYDASQYPGA